jgi:HAD superfamily hydrolase (TIGR01509 family)
MLPSQPLRAVVFDLDGTLLNTEELYWDVGSELLRRRGHQATRELIDQMMGRPSRVALQIMIDWHELDATVEQLQAETREIFVALLDTRLALMPGVLELLDAADAADLPCAIATSSSRAFLDDALRRLDLAARFTATYTADDVTEGKPHPEIYLKTAAGLALPPGQMLVLEDSSNGCRAAVDAGAFTVAVPGEHSRGHDFSGVAFVAEGLGDARIYRALGIAP